MRSRHLREGMRRDRCSAISMVLVSSSASGQAATCSALARWPRPAPRIYINIRNRIAALQAAVIWLRLTQAVGLGYRIYGPLAHI
jgi:hypothetical protein